MLNWSEVRPWVAAVLKIINARSVYRKTEPGARTWFGHRTRAGLENPKFVGGLRASVKQPETLCGGRGLSDGSKHWVPGWIIQRNKGGFVNLRLAVSLEIMTSDVPNSSMTQSYP